MALCTVDSQLLNRGTGRYDDRLRTCRLGFVSGQAQGDVLVSTSRPGVGVTQTDLSPTSVAGTRTNLQYFIRTWLVKYDRLRKICYNLYKKEFRQCFYEAKRETSIVVAEISATYC
jgi:hypothetical protein